MHGGGFDVSLLIDVDKSLLMKVASLLADELKCDGASISAQSASDILIEYGALLHQFCRHPEDTALVVVIDHPSVFFCPLLNGTSGVFIETYSKGKHGDWVMRLHKEDLFDYTNLDARLDALDFRGFMIERSLGL